MQQQEISKSTIADTGPATSSWSSVASDIWHGDLKQASTDAINNVSTAAKAIANDPVGAAGSLIDFATPIGLVDHFAGTHIGNAMADVAAGAAKEVYNHPGTVAMDAALGAGVGALTIATGGGFAVGLALGGAMLAGSELIKNKGNEVNGALNDATGAINGVTSFGNDVAVVAGPGEHKDVYAAKAKQGLENAGAFVAQTAAFGIGAGIGAGLASSITAIGDSTPGVAQAAVKAGEVQPALPDIQPPSVTLPADATPPLAAAVPEVTTTAPQPAAATVPEVTTAPAAQPVAATVPEVQTAAATQPTGTPGPEVQTAAATQHAGTPGPEVQTAAATQHAGTTGPVDAPKVTAQTPGDGSAGTSNAALNQDSAGPKSPVDNVEKIKPATDSSTIADNTAKVMIGGNEVPVSAPAGVDVNAVVNSKPFGDWVKNLDPNIKIGPGGIKIDAVKMFGKKPGFTLLTADATDATTGKAVPGIVFMRGNSVGVLPVLVGPDGSEYAAIVNQTRVPIGQTNFPEIPAGMMDNSGAPKGVAITEVAQETGMKPTDSNLIPLGKIYPSPGGSDEAIDLYAIRQSVTQAQIDQLNGRIGGLAEENEQTRVQLVPLRDLATSQDGKTLAAWAKYQALPQEAKEAGTSAFDTGTDPGK